MQTSNEIDKLAAALSAAQGELTHADKDRVNPHFGSKYATLASVLDACRVPLAKHGLAVVQVAEGDEQKVTVITRLLHASGQWIEGTFACKPGKPDAQGMGSAISYGRRYGLSAIVGIGVDDDDGNAAAHKSPQTPAPAKQAATPAPPAPKPVQTKPAPQSALDVAMTAGRQAATMAELEKAFHAARLSGATEAQQNELRARKVALQTPDTGFEQEPCKSCGRTDWAERSAVSCDKCISL